MTIVDVKFTYFSGGVNQKSISDFVVNCNYYYFGCFYGAFFLKLTNYFDESYNQMGKRHARIGHNALRFELTIKTASRYRRFSHGFQKKKEIVIERNQKR